MPEMEGFAATYGTAVSFFAVDVEEADDLALDLGVTALPRIFFYKDGVKIGPSRLPPRGFADESSTHHAAPSAVQ